MSNITYTLNRYFNVEIKGQEILILVPSDRLKTENVTDLKRGIKRVVIDHKVENNLLVPDDISFTGSYARFNYDVTHYFPMDRLREYSNLKDKIPFFYSILELASQQELGEINIIWERINFLIDEVEQNVKVMMFQTEDIQNYVSDKEKLVDTVKSLIISTLTVLSTVDRLPQRKDFIFSGDNSSIDFVEQLFPLTNLNDIRMLIDSFSLDFEDDLEEEQDPPIESKPKVKSLFPRRNPKVNKNDSESKSKVKKVKTVDINKSNKDHSGKKKLKKTDRNLLIAAVFMILCVVISQFVPEPSKGTVAKKALPKETETYKIKETSSYFKSTDSKAIQNAIVRAYRLAYNQNYQDAYKTLQPIDKSDLSSADLQLVIDVYLNQRKISLLLDEAPVKEVANEVILFLIKRDRIDALPGLTKDMKTNNIYIDFEKAYVEGDYKKVISLMDKVELNGRKENQIVESYLALNQVDEANKFAQKVGNPDLFRKIEGY